MRAIIFWVFMAVSFTANATVPLPPISIKFGEEISHQVSGQKIEVQLALNLTRRENMSDLSAELTWQNLDTGEQKSQPIEIGAADSYQTTISLPDSATYRLEVKLVGGDANDGFSDKDITYLRLENGSVVRMTSLSIALESVDAKQTTDIQTNKETDAEVSGTDMLVRVQVNFREPGGNLVPAKFMEVSLWEDDLFFDDPLGTVHTDENGHAETIVSIPYDPFGVDEIYMIVNTKNNQRFSMGPNASGAAPYSYTSDDTPVYPPTSVTIGYSIVDNVHMKDVWDTFNSLWDYSKDTLQNQTTFFGIQYPNPDPDVAYFSTVHNTVSLSENFYNGPMVIAHEYGHVLMFQLYNGWFPKAGGPHSYCPKKAISNELAWTEGYATSFALASQGSENGIFHWNTGDHGINIEEYSCAYYDLSTDEGRVAAALWDLVDLHDDCNDEKKNRGRDGLCDNNRNHRLSAKQVYVDAIQDRKQNSILEFWDVLDTSVLTDEQKPLAKNIFKYNWVDYGTSRIESFTWVGWKDRIGCNPETVATWKANSPACKLLHGQPGHWKTISEEISGSTTLVWCPFIDSVLRLECDAWENDVIQINEPTEPAEERKESEQKET